MCTAPCCLCPRVALTASPSWTLGPQRPPPTPGALSFHSAQAGSGRPRSWVSGSLAFSPAPSLENVSAKRGACGQGGVSRAPSPLGTHLGRGQAEGRPGTRAQEVHAVIVAVGLQCVAVRVRQLCQQHGAQAGRGARPQVCSGPGQGSPMGGPQAQACSTGHPCPVFSDEVLGPSL